MSLRAPWLCWTILSLLLLAVPVQAAPVSGKLSVAAGVELDGDITWASGARLVEVRANDGVPAFSLGMQAATAEVFVERQETHPVMGKFFGDSFRRAETTPEHLTDVSIAGIRLHEGAHMTADLTDAQATIQTQRATLNAASEVYASVDPKDDIRYTEPLYPYSIAGQDWITADTDSMHMTADGKIVLAFWDADLVLKTADGEREYKTGRWTEDDPNSPLPLSRTVIQFVWMVLDAAVIEMDWRDAALVAGPAPRIDVTGSSALPAAHGSIVLDAIGVTPSTEAVTVTGTYALGPLVDANAEVQPTTQQGQLITHYERFDTGIRGDAERVEVSGRAVETAASEIDPAVAAGAAGIGLLALAGAIYRWGPLALAALYSRLDEGELLNNETRAQIYEIVKQNPGISARQIHRMSTASWGTVVHHLNKLHDAGYVATRTHGRAKCFYENHGKWDAYQEQLAVLTGDKTAAVADAIAAVPGRGQNQIITRTGFSQSTVSYHLLKLEKAGLVSKERTGSSLAYFPTAALCELRNRMPTQTLGPAGAIGGAA